MLTAHILNFTTLQAHLHQEHVASSTGPRGPQGCVADAGLAESRFLPALLEQNAVPSPTEDLEGPNTLLPLAPPTSNLTATGEPFGTGQVLPKCSGGSQSQQQQQFLQLNAVRAYSALGGQFPGVALSKLGLPDSETCTRQQTG